MLLELRSFSMELDGMGSTSGKPTKSYAKKFQE